jgi:hypothetical protein
VKEKPFESLVGVFIVALGIPVYLIWRFFPARKAQVEGA